MPLHWDVAKLKGSAPDSDDAIWATPPGQWADIANHGVLMILCDTQGAHDPEGSVGEAAVSELDNYYYQPPRPYDGPELCLADGIVQAQFIVRYYPAFTQTATPPMPGEGGAVHNGAGSRDAAAGGSLTMIACAVHRGNLYVAHSGRNRAYLWHQGELSRLTVDLHQPSEVDRGRYQLAAKDRVLLCTESFARSVSDTQMAQILGSVSNPTDAIEAMLDVAAEAKPVGTVSAAVLDYTPSLINITPPAAIGTGIVTLVALGAMALFFSGRLSPQPPDIAQVTAQPAPTATAAALPPTATAAPTQTATRAPAATQAPVAAVSTPTATRQATSTATPTPEPTATTTPTAEPSPTPTTTPTPTQMPRPRPTPTPAPTSTPQPSYAQPQLLSPANNALFSGPVGPTFTWSSAGQLAANDYYVLAIQHAKGVDEQWVKGTSASAPDYLLVLRMNVPFQWNVSVRRKSGTAPNGASVGTILTQSSQTWLFTWIPGQAPPTGGGNPPPGPTSPPVPTLPAPP